MTSQNQFAQRFREALIRISAENRGLPEYEAYRLYQTDATFHAMVETIVLTAVQCLEDAEPDERKADLQRHFEEGAGR
jgi:hypothetical protein